ncbi:sensor histidine kinase NtrY-like [Sphingomonas crusticola]|uniref:sensor histidine kinase NtrY-like n=1 Tax=Sphingomonas crusticola TaxID=1697973 RepID=UPI001F0883FF|nr:ATP-binding protein [Sphingomonas crusticola]
MAVAIPLVLIVMLAAAGITYAILTHGSADRPLSPFLIALLLVGNLVPAMALMVLTAQRRARSRSERSPLGGRGGLHVRLVALFSVLAAVPTLLVVIFASLLFQFGIKFWFSDRASVVLQNADRVVQAYINEHRTNLWENAKAMRGDILTTLATAAPDDPRWAGYFFLQVINRQLNQAAVIRIAHDGSEQLIWGAGLVKNRPLETLVDPGKLAIYDSERPHVAVLRDRMETVVPLDRPTRTYLWISRSANSLAIAQSARATLSLDDYRAFVARARTLQLQFNAALFLVSLLTVGIAIWIAFAVADRLVRPIGELVGAARRVAGGDLAARVPAPNKYDEVGRLAAAFNRMTRRLQEQTGALESRRALTEAVLAGVSAGVIFVNRERQVTVINLSAQALLRTGDASAIGEQLHELAPELARMLDSGERQSVVQLTGEGGVRTLAVTVVGAGNGHVLTFDDITQQLADQRHAAWSDVARRIAHEIKNPLTPIQLAAERLQRRYGNEVHSDPGTFERLVSTIVRQVGDIRRMIDEFSSFARMPKPRFARENLLDMARQALFLQEVAHPAIRFSLDAPEPGPTMVCDRRQIGQALTNIVKNACEAVEARLGEGQGGAVAMTIREDGGRLILEVADDGIGLPAERDRLTEPYVTTRAKGTGLGLAIVRRIVEEHIGTLSFADRPGGGTIVHLDFDLHALAAIADEDTLDERTPELVNARSL